MIHSFHRVVENSETYFFVTGHKVGHLVSVNTDKRAPVGPRPAPQKQAPTLDLHYSPFTGPQQLPLAPESRQSDREPYGIKNLGNGLSYFKAQQPKVPLDEDRRSRVC